MSVLLAVILTVNLARAQSAHPGAPTQVVDIPWGATLADVQRLRPEASCRVEHVEDHRRREVQTKQDMEKGLLTIVTPVRFSAACFLRFSDANGAGDITLHLDGEPPTFRMAVIKYQRPTYERVRQSFIDLYGEPDERVTQSLSWLNRVRVWLGWAADEAERLTWKRRQTTLTLDHPKYAHLGRTSGKPFAVFRAVTPSSRTP